MTEEIIAVPSTEGDIPVHVWTPDSGTGPGIVLLQEIFGISGYIQRRAQDLADLGYVVMAPEIYWRLGASSVPEGPEAMEQAFALAQRTDWASAVADGVSTLEALRARPEVSDVGILGFCFGGGLGFNVAAVSSPSVLVSYYGSSLPGLLELAPAVTAPSLHHFGLADSYIDPPTVRRIEQALVAAGPNVSFETYPGADHAFDNSDFPLFDAGASATAWKRTVAFLAEHLLPQ